MIQRNIIDTQIVLTLYPINMLFLTFSLSTMLSFGITRRLNMGTTHSIENIIELLEMWMKSLFRSGNKLLKSTCLIRENALLKYKNAPIKTQNVLSLARVSISYIVEYITGNININVIKLLGVSVRNSKDINVEYLQNTNTAKININIRIIITIILLKNLGKT